MPSCLLTANCELLSSIRQQRHKTRPFYRTLRLTLAARTVSAPLTRKYLAALCQKLRQSLYILIIDIIRMIATKTAFHLLTYTLGFTSRFSGIKRFTFGHYNLQNSRTILLKITFILISLLSHLIYSSTHSLKTVYHPAQDPYQHPTAPARTSAPKMAHRHYRRRRRRDYLQK